MKKLTLVFCFSLSCFSLVPIAESSVHIHCKVASLKVFNERFDQTLGIELDSCVEPSQTSSQRPKVICPISSKLVHEQLMASQEVAKFTVTNSYVGRLIAIDDQDAGSLTPVRDRMIFSNLVTYEGEKSWKLLSDLMDGMRLGKKPTIQHPKQDPTISMASFHRYAVLKGDVDSNLQIELGETGPTFASYGHEVKVNPGSAVLTIQAMHPSGQLGARDNYIFHAEDAKKLYQFLGLHPFESLMVETTNGNIGFLRCVNENSCGFFLKLKQ